MPDWRVPLTDVRFTEDDVAAVAEVYRSGWLSQGPRVAEFERAFAESVGAGADTAVAVSSGTAALHLGLIAAGVAAGDEVLLPSLTFAATAASVVAVGARPVFADVGGLDAPWLSAAAAEAAITPRTRAIVTVAYGGAGGEVTALAELARARGLALVEDAAHAVGATVGSCALGTVGDVGAFSFFANKNLPLGEGGMLVCADPAAADRARRLRSHGLSSGTWDRHHRPGSGYEVTEPGFNYRLDEPRAALGTRLLDRVAIERDRRAALAAGYAEGLSVTGAGEPVIAGHLAEGCGWHIYPVRLPPGLVRAEVRARMDAAGVQTSVHYPPLHRTQAFGDGATASLPATDAYAARTLTLPLFGHMTAAQQGLVLDALDAALRGGPAPL
jgi:dTDP-4-amino-4,6-dideoxygalactose transaminase